MVYQFLVFYLLSLVLLCAFAQQAVGNSSKKGQRVYLVLAFMALALLMGFRSTAVGMDTYHYSLIYKAISNMSFGEIFRGDSHFEIGFALFIKIVSLFGADYYFFQLLFSSLYCVLFYRFIRKNSSSVFTASVLFIAIVYLIAFNISRQMLAVAFVASAWCSLKDRCYRQFVLFFLLAISFHTSAVFSVFIYLIYFYRTNRRVVCLLSIMILALPYFFHMLLPFLEKYFTAYESYYNNTREIQEANLIKIVWGIEALFSLFILLRKKVFDAEKQFIALMCLIYVMTNIVALSFNYFERVGLYFTPFLILLFEIFGEKLRDKSLRHFYFGAVCICFLLLFLRSSSAEQYVYSSFL